MGRRGVSCDEPTVRRTRGIRQPAFVTLADTLVDEYDVIDLLDRLAGFCVELLSADAAGIVLGDARRELRAVAAIRRGRGVMELLQLQSDEGPCLDCFQTAAPVSVADLAEAAGRWPTSWRQSQSAGTSARSTRCRCGYGAGRSVR